MQPDYDLQDIDIVGCGSTIGNLMRFARSESKTFFRFDAEVIGDTVLFIRKENSPAELITDLQGYGHTFPEAYTTWDLDVRNSCSHQRIIGYDFGGLKFLVRTETDAYIRESDATAPPSTLKSMPQTSLNDALKSITFSGTQTSSSQKLDIKVQGKSIPQSQIFDIKTRGIYNTFNMNEILPRLWLNQTPGFLLAYHRSGLFDKPEVKDVRQDIIKWEKDNSSILALFHAVVKRMVDVMRESGKVRYDIYWDGRGPLSITERIGEGERALPADLVSLLETD
jgi:hypothetical protein